MKATINQNFFYHIYPLGMFGTPKKNDFTSPAGDGLLRLREEIPHLLSLGVTAVYLGPLFESVEHGYDTVDYFQVDRRLGTNDDLIHLVRAFHESGIAVVLDAVFNHTGRNFFAFHDVQKNGSSSTFRDWFQNVDFNKKSPAGDNFSYEGWSGHYDLVKLNTGNTSVREHLFSAIKFWIEEFRIDGIRLDAADVLAPEFMDALSRFCTELKSDFWLLGEVVHGDYRNWAKPGRLDSVTNYEVHKGLWSCLNDANFFELAWSLNRQSGSEGIYKNLCLYNFVDNHDVNRVASVLKKQAHLFPLYGLLFSIPGIPSLYYGSEWGIRGEKKNGSDSELRPLLRLMTDNPLAQLPLSLQPVVEADALIHAIKTFAGIRKKHEALQTGTYKEIYVASEQFVFIRETAGQQIIIAANSSSDSVSLSFSTKGWAPENRVWYDVLAEKAEYANSWETLSFTLPPTWLRILVRKEGCF